MRTNLRWTTAALTAGLLVTASACGGGSSKKTTSGSSAGGQELKGVTVEVAAKWTGPEQANFQKVLSAFEKQSGAKVNYASTGENTDAYLGPRIQAHQPPDIAILPQPGLLQQYAKKGQLKALSPEVTGAIDANYTPYWKELGAIPKAGATAPAVVGGDIAVALKDSKGGMALMRYLASPDAGNVWARAGGYISPNKNVKPDVYPDALTRQLVQQMQAAGDAARYDMSDQAPAAFGGTPGQGEWEDLRGLVQNPSDIKGAQAKLEADAVKAYK